jgi:hypothetical protein
MGDPVADPVVLTPLDPVASQSPISTGPVVMSNIFNFIDMSG